MFEYFKGILMDLTPTKATLEVFGIGYSFFIPSRSYSKLLSNVGKEAVLYSTFIVREDSHRLFGFIEKRERSLFEKLSEITGIGPKTALSIISHLSIEELDLAIYHQDVKTLSNIPGIGKKTAERLVVELKDKTKELKKDFILQKSNKELNPLVSDAMLALISLGYSQVASEKAVRKAFEERKEIEKLSELISLSLQLVKTIF